jgi:hypothetical protein
MRDFNTEKFIEEFTHAFMQRIAGGTPPSRKELPPAWEEIPIEFYD